MGAALLDFAILWGEVTFVGAKASYDLNPAHSEVRNPIATLD
jgi:hypothetical protein